VNEAIRVKQDIDFILEGWEYKPGMVQARLVQAAGGRQVIQMRVDLGLLQIESVGRPDGVKPHGQMTYLAYLREQARLADKTGDKFVLTEEQCQEADREFVQYYHRRICWLALRQFRRAVRDADHTLALMNFVKQHSPDEDWTLSHEQYRPFVMFHRVQASALAELEEHGAEPAINELKLGLDKLREVFEQYGVEEKFDEDELVRRLVELQDSLREHYRVGQTLNEQLAEAVAEEKYELAAQLRDEIARRQVRQR
jgi:UvrB/UvrC motif-containing protein